MTQQLAIKSLLWLISSIIVFHLLILVKIIPYDITWGGRLKSDADMYVFESISIVLNLFLVMILLIKGHYLSSFIPMKIVNFFLWFFLILFGLNTIGNLLAETTFEKFFAILTLAFTVLIGIILKKGKGTNRNSTQPTQ